MSKVEIVTNVIDGVAFMMVTVDLYGRERLEALREQLLKVKLPRFDPFSFRKSVVLYKEPGRQSGWREVAIVAGAVGATMTGLFAILGLVFYVADGLTWGWDNANAAIWDDTKFSLALLAGVYAFAAVIYLIWLARTFAVSVFIYLTQIFPIEGMMVVIGAGLFLLARATNIVFLLLGGQ